MDRTFGLEFKKKETDENVRRVFRDYLVPIVSIKRLKVIGQKKVKQVKKENESVWGIGGMLCPSNPKFYRLGYEQAIKDLFLAAKKRASERE